MAAYTRAGEEVEEVEDMRQERRRIVCVCVCVCGDGMKTEEGGDGGGEKLDGVEQQEQECARAGWAW